MFADRKEAEAKLVTPVRIACRKLQFLEQGTNGSLFGFRPCDIATIGEESSAHIEAIGIAILHHPNGGECLQPIFFTEGGGRRVVDDAIARLDALQRRALAVTDLHETFRAAAPDVLGRGHRDPMSCHGKPP